MGEATSYLIVLTISVEMAGLNSGLCCFSAVSRVFSNVDHGPLEFKGLEDTSNGPNLSSVFALSGAVLYQSSERPQECLE